MKPMIIVSDPGIDDMVALLLLAKLSEGAKHCLVSSFGNAHEAIISQNAKECVGFAAPQLLYLQRSSMPMHG